MIGPPLVLPPAISPSLIIMPLQSGYVSGGPKAYTGTGTASAGVVISANYIGTASREFGLSCISNGPSDILGRDCSGAVTWVVMNSPGKMTVCFLLALSSTVHVHLLPSSSRC